MKNFEFYNPVRLVFGRDTIAQLAELVPTDTRVLVTYGGGSVKKNGVYEQVTKALERHDTVEFWGIEANPKVETLRKAIALGKERGVGFVLAVGGGSVLDASKLIAGALLTDEDAWDIVLSGGPKKAVPLGTVLTLPATGSEMNSGGVISNLATGEKFGFFGQFPRFSILDPQVTNTLPERQIALGLADTFVHVMEQYICVTGESRLMDRWAESLLVSLVELSAELQENPTSYDLRADFMLCATMALNGFISMGVTQDWATHLIGHELTALHGLEHGATLAIVLPALLRTLSKQKAGKLLQYGSRVWGITEGTDEERIAAAIDSTEKFFRSIGLSTRLGEENIGQDTISEIKSRFDKRKAAYGEARNVDGDMAVRILQAALL